MAVGNAYRAQQIKVIILGAYPCFRESDSKKELCWPLSPGIRGLMDQVFFWACVVQDNDFTSFRFHLLLRTFYKCCQALRSSFLRFGAEKVGIRQ